MTTYPFNLLDANLFDVMRHKNSISLEDLIIAGKPVGQGSMKHVGKHRLIHANSGNLHRYREAIAIQIKQDNEAFKIVNTWKEATDNIAAIVKATYHVKRPQSHYDKNGEVKKKAPIFPAKRTGGDLDKLQRATGDAIEISGLIKDDAQIIQWVAGKRFVPFNSVEFTALSVYLFINER